MQHEQVILVDSDDKQIGTKEKLQAHKDGDLHRAFSIFIFRNTEQGLEVLLQQRQENKYHSANLWANSCCSHPRPQESILNAANRRLKEELNIYSELKLLEKFIYKSQYDNGLIEHELDYVLYGYYSDEVTNFNQTEVQACKWMLVSELSKELRLSPDRYSSWLPHAWQVIITNLAEIENNVCITG